MRRPVTLGLTSLILLLPAIDLGAGPQSSAPPKPTLDQLSWMVGSFAFTQSGTRVEEHWIPEGGKTMLAVGRTIQGDRTVFFEFLRLEERADGIYYIAHPKAAPGTEFKLTQLGERSVTFENPKHDHPKIIRYHRESDDSLIAEVEGDEGGQHVVERLPYRPIEKE